MINAVNITSLYVSQKSGNDDNMGFFPYDKKLQGPLKSIEKAIERIADIRRSGAYQPIRIVLLDDIYFVKKPIVIDENVFAVTITSNCNTIISGGFQIKGFRNDVFNGQKCLSADVPVIKNDGIWFTDLYVDGKRADFTSYPREGLLKPESVENPSTELMASSKWFIADKKDVEVFKNFRNFNDCFISYNHYWVDEHSPIESYDLESGKIVFKYPSRFTIELTNAPAALEYKIENVAEAFQNKNEWYLDRETSKVYYIPRNDRQTAENISVFAPLTNKLFIIKGTKEKTVDNITLSGLTLMCTKGDYRSMIKRLLPDTGEYIMTETDEGLASDPQSVCFAHGSIEFYYAHGCAIENCTLKNLGVHAVTVNNGCSGIRIFGNKISDIGAGGIKINGGVYGCEDNEKTYRNTISQNVITDCGNRYFAACGILIMHSFENTVANNEISYLYYSGVSVGWVWGYKNSISRDNIIENNHIHHLGLGKLSDMGGIYLLGKQKGTIVRNNLIHDVISSHYGGWAIYTDEGSSYITVENNVCYNLTNNCYHQHYGSMNTIRNNIFVKSGGSPVNASKSEMHTGIILENNIIVSEKDPSFLLGKDEWAGSIQIEGHMNLHYNINKEAVILKVGDKEYGLKEYQEIIGKEDGSIVADPMFADYKSNNFELSDNSPAFKLGFKKINMKNTGVTLK